MAGTPTRPLVPERLPVAIRASETVEGRARLYRKANARDRAATALRSTTRTRLAPHRRIPAQAHAPEALLPALSARLAGDGQALHALLFGPPPSDDAALISSPTNSTPSKERYAVHDGPDH